MFKSETVEDKNKKWKWFSKQLHQNLQLKCEKNKIVSLHEKQLQLILWGEKCWEIQSAD